MGKCVPSRGALAYPIGNSPIAHVLPHTYVLLTETGAVFNVVSHACSCLRNNVYPSFNTLTPQLRGSGNSDAATSALEIAGNCNTRGVNSRAEVNRRLKAKRFPDPRHLERALS
jgi:hypothetical protein